MMSWPFRLLGIVNDKLGMRADRTLRQLDRMFRRAVCAAEGQHQWGQWWQSDADGIGDGNSLKRHCSRCRGTQVAPLPVRGLSEVRFDDLDG